MSHRGSRTHLDKGLTVSIGTVSGTAVWGSFLPLNMAYRGVTFQHVMLGRHRHPTHFEGRTREHLGGGHWGCADGFASLAQFWLNFNKVRPTEQDTPKNSRGLALPLHKLCAEGALRSAFEDSVFARICISLQLIQGMCTAALHIVAKDETHW